MTGEQQDFDHIQINNSECLFLFLAFVLFLLPPSPQLVFLLLLATSPS